MKFVFPRGREASLAIVLLLAFSFLAVFSFSPVHAVSPVVNHVCASGSFTANPVVATCAITVTSAGDVIVIAVSIQNSGTATTPTSVASITDGFSNAYAVQMTQGNVVASAGQCAATLCGDAEIWSTTTATTGSDTITVTSTSDSSSPFMMFVAYDISGIAAAAVNTASGLCSTFLASTTACLSGTVASTNPTSFGVNTVQIAAASTTGANYLMTPGSSVWTLGGNVNAIGASEYATASTFGQVSPTTFPITKGASGGSTYWVEVGAVFGPSSSSVTTTTSVLNTSCLGACSGGNNGTAQYLPPPTSTFFNLHFYASQNLQIASQVDNVSLKVSAVHINAATGTIYVLVYTATGAPTGGNPYSLQTTVAVTLTNGTSNFFIHTNPQSNLAANVYYAVGVMTTTTASRGSGASGSGVSIYETSQVGITEYKYAVGSSTPPTSFYSNTVQSPHDFIYIHTTFTVAVVTTTSTTTIGGTATTTVTSTSTNTVNQLDMSKAGFWFMPLIFLLAPMALLVAVKRIAAG